MAKRRKIPSLLFQKCYEPVKQSPKYLASGLILWNTGRATQRPFLQISGITSTRMDDATMRIRREVCFPFSLEFAQKIIFVFVFIYFWPGRKMKWRLILPDWRILCSKWWSGKWPFGYAQSYGKIGDRREVAYRSYWGQSSADSRSRMWDWDLDYWYRYIIE